jgi:hypothetical protein
MDDQVVKVLLMTPLYVLGAIELFAVRKLVSRDSFKVFIWGMAFAIASLPLWALIGVADVAPGPEPYVEMGGRLIRIWLILFTLAVVGRVGLLIVKYVWRRRPRGHTAPASSEADRNGPQH